MTRNWSRGMRIGLGGVAAAALLAAAARNWADDFVNVQFHAFQDTRGVTVLSPTLDLDKDFTDRTGVRVRFGVDAVSAASDSCARCHPDGAHNQRKYADFSILRKFGDWKIETGAEISRENFYAADTLMGSVSRDFNKGNTTIAGGYSFSMNRPQLHPLADVEHQTGQDAYASVTQTLAKGTIVQVAYDYNRISGYQNNPFLRAMVDGIWMNGQTPDLRNRQAVAVRLRQALPGDTYLQADYRHYVDDWSLHSNTLELGLTHDFGERMSAGFSYRRYDQNGAFFYQPQYTGSPTYLTGDFRLAPFTAGLYAGHVDFTPHDGFWGLPAGSTLTLGYERYLSTTAFQAAVFTAGVKVPLK